MKRPFCQHVKQERGAVLVISLLVMTVLLVQGLVFLAIANTEDTIASNFRNYTQAFYTAEAGLESGLVDLRDLLAANSNPLDAQLAVLAPPALTDTNYTFDAFQIALWHGQQAIGSWRCCGNSGDNYYRPPNRNWAYDPLFNTTIPPGTPVGILVMRGRWAQG